MFLIVLFTKYINLIFIFASEFLVSKSKYIAIKDLFTFFILHYSKKLETDILLTKNQSYYI